MGVWFSMLNLSYSYLMSRVFLGTCARFSQHKCAMKLAWQGFLRLALCIMLQTHSARRILDATRNGIVSTYFVSSSLFLSVSSFYLFSTACALSDEISTRCILQVYRSCESDFFIVYLTGYASWLKWPGQTYVIGARVIFYLFSLYRCDKE